MYQVTKENIIGIGKIKLYPTAEHPYDIPVLHYVVFQEEDGSCSAVCLELRIEANAKTVKSVREKIVEYAEEFIINTFRFAPDPNSAYDSLISLTEIDESNIQQWNIYRFCQLKLSYKGVKTDLVMELEQEIKNLKKQIVELESAQKFVNESKIPYSDEFMEYAA